MTRRLFALLMCLTLFGSGLYAQGWPAFRGGSLGGVGTGNPPARWDISTGTNIAWKTAIPGMGHSGPIVAGSTVFVTTAVPVSGGQTSVTLGNVDQAGIASVRNDGPFEWRLIALDSQTGQQKWSVVAHTGSPRVRRHVKASHASATPATNGDVVVALMGSEGLFCFDASDGTLRWKQEVGTMDVGLVEDPTYQWGPASSPVIAGDLVLVQNDQNDRQAGSFLAAYDLSTGRQVWKTAHEDLPSWATPLVASDGDRSIVVTNSPVRIRAHDLTTGRELWHLQDGTEVKVPSPVSAGSRVIVTGGYAPGTRPTWAIPLDAQGAVAADDLAWTIPRGSPYTSSPLVYEGLLYMATDAGILSAYDVQTGQRLYQQRLAAGSGMSASPVAAAGRIYFTNEDGDVSVVRAGRTFELLATNSMGEVTMASPALEGNTIFMRTTGHVVAIRSDRQDGV